MIRVRIKRGQQEGRRRGAIRALQAMGFREHALRRDGQVRTVWTKQTAMPSGHIDR